MPTLLKLLRLKQWLKNGFVFLPMFYSRQLIDITCIEESAWAFFAFCLISSAVYCINDIKDVEADRNHPEKRFRPIASGSISVRTAVLTTCILVAAAYIVLFLAPTASKIGCILILSLYFVLNLAYSLKLKNYSIVDVTIISLGFVLRLAMGGIACGIWLSPWIVSLTFLLSLFLAFAKRRDDVILFEKSGVVARKSIAGYNSTFINQTLAILASVTMVCYIMYTVSPEVVARLGSGYVYVTSLFVLAGILRYLQLTFVKEKSGSPTAILIGDRFIHVCVAGWALTFLLLIYF